VRKFLATRDDVRTGIAVTNYNLDFWKHYLLHFKLPPAYVYYDFISIHCFCNDHLLSPTESPYGLPFSPTYNFPQSDVRQPYGLFLAMQSPIWIYLTGREGRKEKGRVVTPTDNKVSPVYSVPADSVPKPVTNLIISKNVHIVRTSNFDPIHFNMVHISRRTMRRQYPSTTGRAVNTRASYLGGPGLNSRPRDRLPWLRCSFVFLSHSRQLLG
jgi:hypothetical protein